MMNDGALLARPALAAGLGAIGDALARGMETCIPRLMTLI